MALNNHVEKFTLDMAPGGIAPVLNVSQGDIGRKFTADIFWGGSSYDVSGLTAKVRGRKRDNTVFEYVATVSGTTATFETKKQMTIIPGNVDCEIVFFDSSSHEVGTANFTMIVEEAPYDPDAPSQSVIPGIEDLIEQTIGGDVRDETDAWLDAHPEATTTIQDGAITKAKINTAFLPEIENAYVTPQMYGAVADGTTDDAAAIQAAIDSGFPVLIPTGEYYISQELVINRNGVEIIGCGMEETDTKIKTNGTNAFHIVSGHRIITIKNICMSNAAEDCAGIEISGAGNSTHFITIENVMINRFKYGILSGGTSNTTSNDGNTYLWNCAFRDIKINSFDSTADRTGIRILYNGGSNFGLIFERIYINGYKRTLELTGTESFFLSCNFGINSVKSVLLQTAAKTQFIKCNFECDSKVTGILYDAAINAGYITKFSGCSFIADFDSNTSMFYWGSDYTVLFEGCTYKAKTGNQSPGFFSKSIASGKYSCIFNGGNETMPRPEPFASRTLQVLDLERSALPIRAQDPASETPQIGEMQYNNITRVGAHPIWYTGTEWLGAPGGQWGYLDGIESGGTTTVTLTTYDDRPRTAIVTVRGNSSEVYYTGILYFYRGAQASTLVQLAANRCTVTNANNGVLTITNNATNTQYMYWSIVNLI